MREDMRNEDGGCEATVKGQSECKGSSVAINIGNGLTKKEYQGSESIFLKTYQINKNI